MYRKSFNDSQIGIRGNVHRLPKFLSESLTAPKMSRLSGWSFVICNLVVYNINVTSGDSKHDRKKGDLDHG